MPSPIGTGGTSASSRCCVGPSSRRLRCVDPGCSRSNGRPAPTSSSSPGVRSTTPPPMLRSWSTRWSAGPMPPPRSTGSIRPRTARWWRSAPAMAVPKTPSSGWCAPPMVSALSDVIPHTRAASVAWEPDGSGFFYTRYPDGGEYHRSVFWHGLGTRWADDPLVWRAADEPTAWPVARTLRRWPVAAGHRPARMGSDRPPPPRSYHRPLANVDRRPRGGHHADVRAAATPRWSVSPPSTRHVGGWWRSLWARVPGRSAPRHGGHSSRRARPCWAPSPWAPRNSGWSRPGGRCDTIRRVGPDGTTLGTVDGFGARHRRRRGRDHHRSRHGRGVRRSSTAFEAPDHVVAAPAGCRCRRAVGAGGR